MADHAYEQWKQDSGVEEFYKQQEHTPVTQAGEAPPDVPAEPVAPSPEGPGLASAAINWAVQNPGKVAAGVGTLVGIPSAVKLAKSLIPQGAAPVSPEAVPQAIPAPSGLVDAQGRPLAEPAIQPRRQPLPAIPEPNIGAVKPGTLTSKVISGLDTVSKFVRPAAVGAEMLDAYHNLTSGDKTGAALNAAQIWSLYGGVPGAVAGIPLALMQNDQKNWKKLTPEQQSEAAQSALAGQSPGQAW